MQTTTLWRSGAFLLALAPLVTPVAAQIDPPTAPRPITHEDLWLMQRLGATAVSPDGRWRVVAVTEPSYEEGKSRADLWLFPRDGEPRRLTGGRASEGDPVFSPDSTLLAFTAKRDDDESSQIYLLPLTGGEAQRLTNWPGGAKSPRFHPEGTSILFVGATHPGALTEDDNRKAAEERKARKHSARVYETFPVRHWDRWLDELRPSLLVQDIGGGPARDLLAGSSLRLGIGYGGQLGNEGDAVDATWTPDGSAVVFTATQNRHEGARADVHQSLWLVDRAGGEPTALTGDEGSYSAPRFTPDGGRLLAKFEESSPQWTYSLTQLVGWSWPERGERVELSTSFDESIGQYEVSPDSRRVYFLADQICRTKLFALELETAAIAEVGNLAAGTYGRFSLGGPATAPHLVATWSSAANPQEFGEVDLESGAWTRLSQFNTQSTAALDLAPAEEFWFTSSRGKRIHSLLVRPPGFDPAKKYPAFALMHGGPHSLWKDDFILRWNYHLLAQPGYALILTNYSGSTGFGEEFARSIQGDPLQGPTDEVHEAVDAALALYPFLDGTRLAAGGASYGGHMANWIAVTNHRYKALVSHAGLFDLRTQWTTSDIVHSRERNMGGPPWEDLPVWREQSPFYRSMELKTPILVTFGERDYRVPINNGLEFWSMLQRQNVPSRFVVFPDENHWILKGENSRFFYGEVHGWLARYL